MSDWVPPEFASWSLAWAEEFNGPAGFGTVFKMDPSGTVTVLHAFTGIDGAHPRGLVQASDGAFYGTASIPGGGVIFRLVLTVPSMPQNLVAISPYFGQIDLTWTASTSSVGILNYVVERCQGAGCSAFTKFGTLVTGTTFADTGLATSTSYSYIVRAQDAAGNLGPYSNVATATTAANGATRRARTRMGRDGRNGSGSAAVLSRRARPPGSGTVGIG